MPDLWLPGAVCQLVFRLTTSFHSTLFADIVYLGKRFAFSVNGVLKQHQLFSDEPVGPVMRAYRPAVTYNEHSDRSLGAFRKSVKSDQIFNRSGNRIGSNNQSNFDYRSVLCVLRNVRRVFCMLGECAAKGPVLSSSQTRWIDSIENQS